MEMGMAMSMTLLLPLPLAVIMEHPLMITSTSMQPLLSTTIKLIIAFPWLPSAVTHAASTSAAAGKRNNESASTDGVNENTKKKPKKNVSRQVTLPQSSNK
jgi:hypothetical protein